MTTGEALERIVNGFRVPRADTAIVHNLLKTVANFDAVIGDDGGADGEEVRAEATDEPFQEDLKYGGGDEAVEQANDCIVNIPEGACLFSLVSILLVGNAIL